MKTKTLEYTNGKTKFIGYLASDEARSGRAPGHRGFSRSLRTRRSREETRRASGAARLRRARRGHQRRGRHVRRHGAARAPHSIVLHGSVRVAIAGARGIGCVASRNRESTAHASRRSAIALEERLRSSSRAPALRSRRSPPSMPGSSPSCPRTPDAFDPKCWSVTVPTIRSSTRKLSTAVMTELKRDKVDWQVVYLRERRAQLHQSGGGRAPGAGSCLQQEGRRALLAPDASFVRRSLWLRGVGALAR